MLATTLRRARPFFLVAGPCVIESKDVVLEIAHSLKAIGDELQIPVVFKASFDKANRQDIASFRGPGLDQGLAILEAVKAETGLPLLTDVHETYQVQAVGDVVDIVQIPAYLCRQTDLLVAAARTGKLVNIKKGQMCSADTMVDINAVFADVILTDRGTMFGYGDLVVDPRNIPKLRANGALVVQDITHSVQRTGASTTSGGDREFIPTIARMAAAVGVDGLFIETHPDPSRGLSDATTMLPLHELRPLLTELIAIAHASQARRAPPSC
ncbi:3-deoxy-8-phosphooctulonate synthase [Saprolegnia parasitica CBS 223.65]|uniref:3-deoxy-8-phosphooctulonate synthase n=1 Tax=Saprolegnia parasitica (strain CBS 223.65) TaxID=695850 RepID=A0A067BT90_SAPPC|nr:3-deoxy-8-phosphooctulonate synthase [Saprolegnia parasitica CBS 223.65]KDO21483.1 3-deoxy-8-phosphooctulonate synthase [Saprolegnia parasitica CBS 223.65]|eukprot:XP_012207827.1 3-deoxy-8-phosphooctulonate synthase [Saprolegnia parasitica CBS 223.65]